MPFALARESLPDSLPSMAVKSATGPAIVIGGALRDDNSAVWSRLIDLAGGPGAHFVVLATASGDPDAAARGTIAALTAHGAVAEHLRVAPELKGVDLRRAVRDPALIDKVRAANGVFFTGGDQARIVVTLLKGPLRPDQDFGAGLDFAQSDLFVDQHFLRRGRLGRMLPLMHARGMTLGLGVEEDSAAILRGDQVEVLGPGGAVLVDLAEATTDTKLGAFNLSNAKLTYLGHGDRYDLRTHTLTPARAKLDGQFIDPRATDFKPYYEDAPFALDVLAAGVVLESMIRIVDGRATESRGLAFDAGPNAPAPRDLGFEFRFSRRSDTLGWYDPVASADAYTLANIRLDVVPVRVAQPLFGPWHR